MNGGRPLMDMPLVDYYNGGGFAVSDSEPSTSLVPAGYAPALLPEPQAPPSGQVNLALGKAATQSSTYPAPGTAASNAVDGITSGGITHTNLEAKPWWQVDLGAIQQVESVKLWNRLDCCQNRLSNFYVFISDSPFSSNDPATTAAQSGVWSYYVTGQAPDTLLLTAGRTGRYVRVQLTGTEYLSLREVEVFGEPNLAAWRSTTQSSTYPAAGTAPDNAVDGNTANITHTNLEAQPWWQVDLGTVQQLSTVRLWNRPDCCQDRLSNFYVFVSDVPFQSGSLQTTLNQAGVSNYYTSGAAGAQKVVNIGRTGRYVRVQLTGTNYLSLAEVQVLGSANIGTGTGLTGEYYDNDDFTGYKLTRIDPTVNFDWGSNSPDPSIGNDFFSVRWTGMVVPRYSETYTFYTTTDDGVRLWIDGQTIIDKWVDQGPTEWTGQVYLEAGRAYSIRMEFYEHWGGATAKLSWSSASQAKEIVPQSQLYGCWKDVERYVRDFYQAALARQPSAVELQDWMNRLTQAQSEEQLIAQAQSLGAQLFTSTEYAARNRSDSDYVSDLYWAYLQRAPDQGGLNFWTGPIAACGSDQQCRATKRAETRVSFDQSDEFKEKVRRLCGTSSAASDNGGVGYDFATARLDPNNRTGGGGADPYSRNFNFSIPILSLPGRAGIDLGLVLSYNSLVWTKDSTGITFDADEGFPSSGFRLGFPVVQPKFFNPQTGKKAYMLITPSGGRVELRQVGTSNNYESADSSYLQLTEGSGLTLRSTDGTQLSFSLINGSYRSYQVKDKNGNYISVSYYGDGRVWQLTDTLGRTVTFNYDAYQNLSSITQPWKRETEVNPSGVDETHEWATLGYTNVVLRPSFTNLAVMGDQPGTVIPALSQVGLGDGSYYKFEYNDWGQVWKLTHYAADAVDAQHQPTYTHALASMWFKLPGAGASVGGAAAVPATPQSDCPRFEEQRVWAEKGLMNQDGEVTTGYSPSWSPNMASCDVTSPDGTVNRGVYATSGWQRGLTTELHVLSGTQEKKWTTLSWTQDDTSVGYLVNPRFTETVVNDIEGNHRRSTFSYQTFALPDGASCSLPQEMVEYDANGSVPLRTTRTDYNLSAEYLNRRIIGLPSFEKVYDGTYASGTLMSKVGYIYDDTGRVDNDPNQPNYLEGLPSPASQHDGSNYGVSFAWRGNTTRVRHYDVTGSASTYLETKLGYNVTGTQSFTKDPANHYSSVSYSDAFFQNVNRTGANPQTQLKTFAFPTTVTDADTFTSTSVYNYDMGLVVSTQTPLPNTTQNQPGPVAKVLYDAANRPIKSSVLDGATEKGYEKYIYPDTMRYVQSLTLLDVGLERASLKLLDGLGRMRGSSRDLPNTSGGHSSQLLYLDSMGRVVSTSNPTETDANWNPTGEDAATQWVFTEQTYDWKGRLRTTTKPKLDPNNPNEQPAVSEVVYEGCGCAGASVETITGELVPTDAAGSTQARRKQKVYHDVLGREVKLETYAWNGTSIFSTVTKEYNALNQVKYIKEYRGAATSDGSCPTDSSGTCQLTSKNYDGYGRLTSQQKPEETRASLYSYFEDDTLQWFKDARGAKVSFTYNGRHMVLTANYDLSGVVAGQSVAATPNVTYAYDAVGNRTRMDDGLGWVTYAYNNLSQLDSEARRINDLGRSFTLTYAHNFAGQMKSLTDPFNATVSYVYDQAGQLGSMNANGYTGVSQFITSASYRAWGGVKSISYGNTRSLGVGYDRRMEATSFSIPGVMTKTYDYYADGRVQFLHDQVNNKFDRLYVYDHAGQLSSAYSGIDARSAAAVSTDRPYYEEYQYDERGHLTFRDTEHWSAHPHTFTHTYVKNRNSLWQYDDSGSVTSADARQYAYDAASRLTSQSSTNFNLTQSFDGDGQRVKTTQSTDTTYYVNSTAMNGAVVAEVDAAGNRKQVYIYARDKVLATVSANGSVSYKHSDAQAVSVRLTGVTGLMGGEVTEMDPAGGNVETEDPYLTNPDYKGRGDSGPLYPGYGNVTAPSSGCTIDGVWAPCEMAMRGLESGAAVIAPDNVTRYNYTKKTYEFFHAYADGYSGYAPMSAIYDGGGQWHMYVGEGDPNDPYPPDRPRLVRPEAGDELTRDLSSLLINFFVEPQDHGKPSMDPGKHQDCMTFRMLINIFKRDFQKAWEDSVDSGKENGGWIFHLSEKDGFELYRGSQGEESKMPNEPKEFDEKQDELMKNYTVTFALDFHVHPKRSHDPSPGDVYNLYLPVAKRLRAIHPLGLIIYGPGEYSYYDEDGKLADDKKLDECVKVFSHLK
jgi:YD repeat-containing protein